MWHSATEVKTASFFDWYDSSQSDSCHGLHSSVPTSFLRLDGSFFTAGVCIAYCVQIQYHFDDVRHNLHSCFYATPVGQASNPRPSPESIRLAICNPTAVHKKVDLLMNFQSDIVAVSETSATNVIQKQVSNEMSAKGFRSFWSLPVAPKKATVDNRPSFRGEAVGSAVFTSLPCRQIRCEIPCALHESQRFSACVVRFGETEVLVVCLYGFANRYREGKRPNDLLLASVTTVIRDVALPFIICGDFNEPVEKLPCYNFFKDLGAVEAFHWYHSRHGVMLPPTCGGSTRNDSAIFHPLVAEWIEDMMVLPEHQFDVHTPLFVQFTCKKVHETRLTWNFPRTWAPFAPSKQNIESVYQPVDFQHFFHSQSEITVEGLETALQLWSRHVEKAVDKAIGIEHRTNPEKHPRPSLHSSFRGRCNFRKKKPKMKSLGSNPIAMVDTHRLVKFKRPDAV